MLNLINKYLANGLSDFPGLHVTGTIPVKQEIVNEFIAEILRQGTNSAAHAGQEMPAPDSSSPSPVNVLPHAGDLIGLVKKAEIKADAGRITVEFEIRV